MAGTFSATEIIGKTLVAKVAVPIYRLASDGKPIYTVKAGNVIGVVQSYLNPNATRPLLWWVFQDKNNKPYYAPHRPGLYNINSIVDQGGVSEEEKTKAARQKQDIEDKGLFRYYLEKYAPWIIGALILVPIAKDVIIKKLN